MDNFIFDVEGNKIRGFVERVGSTSSYRGKAKCPACSQEFTVGYMPGDKKKESAIKSSLKSNVIRHYMRAHKDGPVQKKKRRPGW